MKLKLVFTFLLGLTIPTFLFSQDYNWSKSIGGIGFESHGTLVLDDQQNLYSVGVFNNTVDFDPGSGTANVVSNGNQDIYLMKMDSSGNFIWVKSIGGNGSDTGYGLSIDSQGDLIISGSFRNTVDFDPGPGVNNITSTTIFDNDAFILKLNSSGDFQWVKTFSGTSGATASSIELDNSDNIYIYGLYSGTVDFNPGIEVFNKNSNGFEDLFILALDPLGNFRWVNTIGGPGHDQTIRLIFDGNQSLIVGGSVIGNVDLNPGIGVSYSVSAGNDDIFIEKIDTSGSLIWARSFGGSSYEDCYAITTDADGNIYYTGDVWSSYVDFDPGPGTDMISSLGNSDIFLHKLDSNGNHIWIKSMGGLESQWGGIITYHPDGFIMLGGTFYGSYDFDPGPATQTMTSEAGSDSFFQKFDLSGNVIWARSISGNNLGSISEIIISELREIYLQVDFQGTIDADPGANVSNHTAVGNWDIGFIKLNNDPCSNFALVIDDLSNVECGSDGEVSASSIYGNYPVTYSWNTVPATLDSTVIISEPGIYTLTATDDSSCVATTSVLINGPEIQSGFDFNANLITSEFRVGFMSNIWLDGFNNGCTGTNGSMSIVLDELVDFNYSNPSPDAIIGDTLRWNFSSLSYDSTHLTPKIKVTTDLSAAIGDTICFDLIMTPVFGDVDSSNNIKHYCFPVVNGYDPNDKQVFPQGICNNNYISDNQMLTYMVRFQNTGNSEAININVIDSLSPLLNINTLRVIGQSHDNLITEILPNNVVKFRFDNIMLADSTSNEAESHGYVIFEIDPLANLLNNQVIENKVEIYFDYNPAVVTNTVFNTILKCNSYYVDVNIENGVICQNDVLSVTPEMSPVCSNYFWQIDSIYESNADELNWTADTSGIFELTITKSNAVCTKDSTIQLVVNLTSHSEQSISICQGDSILISGSYAVNSGIYFDLLQNSYGCDSIVTYSLTVNPNPSVTLLEFSDDTICSYVEWVSLPEGFPSGGTYSGSNIVGNQFDVLSSGEGIHHVTYTILDSNSCMNSDTSEITVLSCVGINDLTEESLPVYPNPTFGELNIDPKFNGSNFTVYNLDGILLSTGILTSKLDLSSYENGIYYIQIKSDITLIVKVLKE